MTDSRFFNLPWVDFFSFDEEVNFSDAEYYAVWSGIHNWLGEQELEAEIDFQFSSASRVLYDINVDSSIEVIPRYIRFFKPENELAFRLRFPSKKG